MTQQISGLGLRDFRWDNIEKGIIALGVIKSLNGNCQISDREKKRYDKALMLKRLYTGERESDVIDTRR